VSVEMLARDHLARRVEPHHLTEARPGGAEMWQVHSARLVVVRQMPDLVTVAVDLDDGEGGVGQGVDAGARPRLGSAHSWRAADTEDDGKAEGERRILHGEAPPRSVSRLASGPQCQEFDTAVDSGT